MLTDSAQRDSIAGDLGSTLFVVAGAGTGKTSALVSRVMGLLSTGRSGLGGIAAITFTEAAAAELRDRIETALEGEAANGADWAVAALDDLPGAPITTLHGFARRILAEHPVRAGLPPGFEILEPAETAVEEETGFRDFLADLSDDPRNSRLMARVVAFGITHNRLRSLADALQGKLRHWGTEGVPPTDLYEPSPVDGSHLAETLDEALGLAGGCAEASDTMSAHLEEMGRWRRRIGAASTEASLLRLLDGAPSFAADRKGRRDAWPGKGLELVRQALRRSEDEKRDILGRAKAETADLLGKHLTTYLCASAARRRQQGRLSFDDLLVLARRTVKSDEPARRSLRRRYRYILIDEFQDTDPFQLEIATALAGGPPGSAVGPADEEVDAGRLFFVGDPNQSIYRFRGADCSTFASARRAPGSTTVALDSNFRTVPPVLDWVNAVFSELLGGRSGDSGGPSYRPLHPVRAGRGRDHHVDVLGGPSDLPAPELRRLEAEDTARTVREMLEEGWPVEGRDGHWRPVGPSDVGVLVPSRVCLPDLLDAFDRAGIRARFGAGQGWATEEVRELLSVMGAIADPSDQVAVVAAARCSMFGCTDPELAEYVRKGGRWDPLAPVPEDLAPDHSVVLAMDALARWHAGRLGTGVAELVSRVCAEGHLFELACHGSSAAEVWQQLRAIEAHARMVDESGGSLRQFVRSAGRLAASGKSPETAACDAGGGEVEVLTMHGAKGLEFPVAVLCGLGSPGSSTLPMVLEDGSGRAEIRLREELQTRGYQALAERERELAQDEAVRLAYVAATRARDHLVVSCWHRPRRATLALALWEASQRHPELWSLRERSERRAVRSGATGEQSVRQFQPLGEPDGLRLPASLRLPLLTTGSREGRPRRRFAAATGLWSMTGADGSRTEDAEGWRATSSEVPRGDERLKGLRSRNDLRSRTGRHSPEATGTAVHAVLEHLDLASDPGGDEVGRLARSVCLASGVPELEGIVSRLARTALESGVVKVAASRRHWKEMPVAADIGGVLLEGFVDLLYEEREGGPLVVVDYKTDDVSRLGPVELERHSERYGLQAGAYALALEMASGRHVSDCVLLYLGSNASTEVRLGRPAESMEHVVSLLSDGPVDRSTEPDER
ncbi:MAG: UvrD-helicase domain-containing protein [Actinomycetota bacterium]|nr:UvrD-helicase domain-containing protein [Actinomycetota bacterium]